MNGNYYPNPTFPQAENNYQNQGPLAEVKYPTNLEDNRILDIGKRSDIENVLKMNKGKKVNVFTSFSDSNEGKDKEFKGIIEEAEKDYLILSNPTNGEWYLIPMIYINYFNFEERVNYPEKNI